MIDAILGIVSAVGTVANTATSVLELVDKVKKSIRTTDVDGKISAQTQQPIPNALPRMNPFNPQMTNPYGNGNQWLPDLHSMAQQHGNAWVRTTTWKTL
jgi:hypothetical protein